MLLYCESELAFYVFTDGKVPKRNRGNLWPASRLLRRLCAKHVRRHIPAAKSMKIGDSITIDVVVRKPKRKARRTQP